MPTTLQHPGRSGTLSRRHPGKPSVLQLCEDCAITGVSALTDDARILADAARALDTLEQGREHVLRAAINLEMDPLTAQKTLDAYDHTQREIEAALFSRACHVCGKVIPEIKSIVAKAAA